MLSGRYITGLYFHKPSGKVFERCIRWLKKENCTFISTEQLLQILSGKAVFPKRGIWITFDDGWQSNISEVVPVMVKYNIPITFFICSGPAEGKGVFWFTLVRSFCDNLPEIYRHDLKKLWLTSEATRRKVEKNLWNSISLLPMREAMTIEDVRALSQISLATIGSHTDNHALTVNCTDAELKEEIRKSRLKLSKWCGKKIRFFSYPNGDYHLKDNAILQQAGIELAATTKKEFITPTTDRYFVPRFNVNDDAFFPEVLCQMVGAWGKGMNIWNTLFSFFQKKR